MPRFKLVTQKKQTKRNGVVLRAILKEGRKAHASKQGFKTLREAKTWAAEQETKILQAEEAAHLAAKLETRTTFLKASNDYLSWGEHRWDSNTYVGKKGIYKRLLSFLNKHHPEGVTAALDDIPAALIEKYMYWVAKQPKCSNKTSNRHHREIGAVFNHAIKRGLLVDIERVKQRIDNPCHDIEKFSEDEYNRPVPTFEVVELYRGEAKGDESDYIEMMCNTLQRGRSIRILQWQHVNFAEKVVGFRHKKRKGGGFRTVWVHMTEAVETILKRRFKDRETDSPFIFVNHFSGNRYQRNSAFIKKLFHRIRERLEKRLDTDIEPITGHALRHWGSRELDRLGISEKRIGNLLDHQKESTTRLYLETMRVDEDVTEALATIRKDGQRKPKHLKVVK